MEELTKKKEICDEYLESRMEELWKVSQSISMQIQNCNFDRRKRRVQFSVSSLKNTVSRWKKELEHWILLTVRLFPMTKKAL